jgi:hypothetical protein
VNSLPPDWRAQGCGVISNGPWREVTVHAAFARNKAIVDEHAARTAVSEVTSS